MFRKMLQIRALRLVLAFTVLTLALESYVLGQSSSNHLMSNPVHGTVNIWIANSNGLVAVTDSRISQQGKPVGEGQKLFQIDNHTVCTIANWYSWSGPSVDQMHFPAYSSIANVINNMIFHGAIPSNESLEQKIQQIEDAVGFTLEMIQSISAAAGGPEESLASEITVGTYENGHYRIATVTLVPLSSASEFRFIEKERNILEVGKSVAFIVRGIPDVAEPILRNPDKFQFGDVFLKRYAKSIKDDRGSSLCAEDMRRVASNLEKVTSMKHPLEVGGTVEVASVIGSAVDMENPLAERSASSYIIPNGRFDVLKNSHISNGYTGILVDAPYAVLVLGSTFNNLRQQPLDNIMFFANSFEHVTFTYNGSHLYFFDTSNKLVACQLRLTDLSLLSSPEMIRFKRDFPQVPILGPDLKEQP